MLSLSKHQEPPIMFRETGWEDVESAIQKAVSELSELRNGLSIHV